MTRISKELVFAKVLTKEWVAGTYHIPEDSIIFVEISAARCHQVFRFHGHEFRAIQEKPTCIPDSSMHRFLDLQVS